MRFSIRDLLLVTVIVALATAWWLEHRRANALANEAHLLQQEAESFAASNAGLIYLARLQSQAAATRVSGKKSP